MLRGARAGLRRGEEHRLGFGVAKRLWCSRECTKGALAYQRVYKETLAYQRVYKETLAYQRM